MSLTPAYLAAPFEVNTQLVTQLAGVSAVRLIFLRCSVKPKGGCLLRFFTADVIDELYLHALRHFIAYPFDDVGESPRLATRFPCKIGYLFSSAH